MPAITYIRKVNYTICLRRSQNVKMIQYIEVIRGFATDKIEEEKISLY